MEHLITSGRMNPNIDPVLHVWHWEIPLYLFLGGIAAGILFYSALLTLMGREEKYPVAVKWMPLAAPVLIGIGLAALFLDLSHKLYFWQLYTNIRWVSPMSWGAWTLLLITPLSLLWIAIWRRDLLPGYTIPWAWLDTALTYLDKYRKALAWALLLLAIVLGMYTGILLSAFNARPFWNTSILGPLFLVSGLSAAAALAALFAGSPEERHAFTRIDLIMLSIELVLLVHLVMGFLAGSQAQIDAVQMILGGSGYTITFWGGIVIIGILLPLFLEAMELSRRHVPVLVPVIMIITGNLLLRFLFVELGQVSRYFY